MALWPLGRKRPRPPSPPERAQAGRALPGRHARRASPARTPPPNPRARRGPVRPGERGRRAPSAARQAAPPPAPACGRRRGHSDSLRRGRRAESRTRHLLGSGSGRASPAAAARPSRRRAMRDGGHRRARPRTSLASPGAAPGSRERGKRPSLSGKRLRLERRLDGLRLRFGLCRCLPRHRVFQGLDDNCATGLADVHGDCSSLAPAYGAAAEPGLLQLGSSGGAGASVLSVLRSLSRARRSLVGANGGCRWDIHSLSSAS
jgi:hypothetical protein